MMRIRPSARFLVLPLILAGVLGGCRRDPAVRKEKYFQSGEQYLAKRMYREAAIQYQNAIQIDPRFTRAHYGLAQCFLREASWQNAYRELTRTVELEPTNWKAQLDLGNLFFASGKFPDAHDRAQTVLNGAPQNAQAELLLANAD